MMLQRRLEGGWSIMVAALSVALLTLLELSFNQWRLLIVAGLLTTTIMLYHKRLRHFVLLPSCVVFASGLLLIIMNLSEKGNQ
jgi:4-hydroxybenzoate polyprenyltransferase